MGLFDTMTNSYLWRYDYEIEGIVQHSTLLGSPKQNSALRVINEFWTNFQTWPKLCYFWTLPFSNKAIFRKFITLPVCQFFLQRGPVDYKHENLLLVARTSNITVIWLWLNIWQPPKLSQNSFGNTVGLSRFWPFLPLHDVATLASVYK